MLHTPITVVNITILLLCFTISAKGRSAKSNGYYSDISDDIEEYLYKDDDNYVWPSEPDSEDISTERSNYDTQKSKRPSELSKKMMEVREYYTKKLPSIKGRSAPGRKGKKLGPGPQGRFILSALSVLTVGGMEMMKEVPAFGKLFELLIGPPYMLISKVGDWISSVWDSI